MGLPRMKINFLSERTSDVERGETGIVYLLMCDDIEEELINYEISEVGKMPDELSDESRNNILMAFESGYETLSKVIISVFCKEKLINEEYKAEEILEVIEKKNFNYLAITDIILFESGVM